jgi:hypothetical protein
MTWLLLVYFSGRTILIEMERFETEALCRAAGTAAIQMYAERRPLEGVPPWRCVNLETVVSQR